MRLFLICIILSLTFLCCNHKEKFELSPFAHDLDSKQLAKNWDKAIPLGNGFIGALIWQKDSNLRFSLDRADLWDHRPMENIGIPEWKFSWVYKQWQNNTYKLVQDKFDAPYDNNPAPSKIPAAALEFNTTELGEVENAHLYIKNAVCEVKWKNGAQLLTYIHAEKPFGWFRFEGVKNNFTPELIAPNYNLGDKENSSDPVSGQDLVRLGYPKGDITKSENSIKYTQKGWGNFEYHVFVEWKRVNKGIEGCWSITSNYLKDTLDAQGYVENQIKTDFRNSYTNHATWWNNFWSKSSINIPDTLLERQWYLEMYKFGSCARKGAPPISLQSIWTADNGKLPPWKGDFHHDLNTQLSYWPSYSSNHVDLEEGFIDWLWEHRDTFKTYTKSYFGTEGLNVPGVSTIDGKPMGGWIQYAFGPTVSAWLGQNFYLHWLYSGDQNFLKDKAYPWFKDVSTYLEQVSIIGSNGKRKLPISSSPEINDNSREAWFGECTNFDLALIKFAFSKSAELANELNLKQEADHWNKILLEWPDFSIDPTEGMMFAPGFRYQSSHRHFSHLMAIHPLGIIDCSNGSKDQQIIQNTINNLDKYGSDWWVGYSFSWLGNLKARAFDGDGAAKALKIFAEAFCFPNSFHVNGDQLGGKYAKSTYCPFTLEGNFAFASGIQEMLIQSHTEVVRVFPAIPSSWKDASFKSLRTAGAFLVSAKRVNGLLSEISITSEKGGIIKIFNSFQNQKYSLNNVIKIGEEYIELQMKPNESIILKNSE